MKAIILFTGTGPILILTTHTSVNDPAFIQKLSVKGLKKFIAYEIPLDKVKDRYGTQYVAVINDVKQTDDLRVLDYNGHNVFYNFAFSDMREPVYYEP